VAVRQNAHFRWGEGLDSAAMEFCSVFDGWPLWQGWPSSSGVILR